MRKRPSTAMKILRGNFGPATEIARRDQAYFKLHPNLMNLSVSTPH